MKLHIPTCLSYCLATLAYAQDVIELNQQNFKQALASNEAILVNFMSSTCTVCKDIAPEYEKAAAALSKDGITVARVNCNDERPLCRAQDIHIYPTLKVFKQGEKEVTYTGDRIASEIVPYTKKQALPSVSTIMKDSFQSLKADAQVLVVAFLGDGEQDADAVKSKFASVSQTLRDSEFVFAMSEDSSLASDEGIKQPGIALYKKYDQEKTVYAGSMSDERNIELWIRQTTLPLLDELNDRTWKRYRRSELPLVTVFVQTPQEQEKYSQALNSFAKEYRGKVNIATTLVDKSKGYAQRVGLSTFWPAVAAQDPETEFSMSMDYGAQINEQNMARFVDKFLIQRERDVAEDANAGNETGAVHQEL